jgi:hypothetical protein
MVPHSSLQHFFTSLPFELVQLIVEYLKKGEQYLCLSLSKHWLSLLHWNRIICISIQGKSNYYPCPHMWSMFRDCDEKIMRVIDAFDFGNEVDDEDTGKLILRRKLTLNLTRAKVEESLKLILKHVQHFSFSPQH